MSIRQVEAAVSLQYAMLKTKAARFSACSKAFLVGNTKALGHTIMFGQNNCLNNSTLR
jgi:hypothetical protein